MPPIQQQPNPMPAQPPIIVKSGHSAWFYVLMTILSILGIAIVLFIAAFVYHEVQLQQARQQLQTAEQQVQANQQQIQDAINGSSDTSSQGTAPTSVNAAPAGVPSATIDQTSLVSTSHTPIITGTATNVTNLHVFVGDDSYGPTVVDGKWSTYSPVTLAPGTYPVIIKISMLAPETVLATGTLVVK
jgi:type II secretory pathway pseudopilin PulG